MKCSCRTSPLLFVVGLTGVGKSTTLAALEETAPGLTFLPNRRDLTDTVVIPAMLVALGEEVKPVTDRLERFRLTAAYRARYPGGLVWALAQHLAEQKISSTQNLVFDNIRGVDECRAALETFSNTRFLFLDAPPLVRLTRLVGRKDVFDEVSASFSSTAFSEHLKSIEGLEHVFNPADLTRLEKLELPPDELLDGVRIIVAEHAHYTAAAAAEFLRANLDAARLLYLDSSELSMGEVTAAIRVWL